MTGTVYRVSRPEEQFADAQRVLDLHATSSADGCWLVRVLTRRLLTRADIDPLTGLPGRAVAERLLDAVACSRRPMTVAFADADQLSTINSVSHADGDRYLIAVARRLCGVLAGQSIVVRFGGDEFVLFTGLSPAELRAGLEAAPRGTGVDRRPHG